MSTDLDPLTTTEVMALADAKSPWWKWWLFALVALILSTCVGGLVVGVRLRFQAIPDSRWDKLRRV